MLALNRGSKSDRRKGSNLDRRKQMDRAYSDKIALLIKNLQPYKIDFEDRPVRSLDTFQLNSPIEFTCPSRNRIIESDVVYINPYNHQVYLLCPLCKTPTRRRDWKAWHLIKDHEIRDVLLGDLSICFDKYKKKETEEDILWLVRNFPGINHYQISQELEITPGRTRRAVARLKKKHLVRTRRVGKAVRIYPMVYEIGTDFTISGGEEGK